jgi:hypothetical protein
MDQRGFTLTCMLVLLLGASAPNAPAQGTSTSMISGRVLADSLRIPVPGAVIRIPKLAIEATTDSAGRYRLAGLPDGAHRLEIRARGFGPDSVDVDVGVGESVALDIIVRISVTTLEVVRVSVPEAGPRSAKLAGFEERRKKGVGRFVDRETLEKWEQRPTGYLFATIPGVNVLHERSKSFAIGSRAHPFFRFDQRRNPCFMDIYLDGAFVAGEPFDLNAVRTAHIEAIEVYASAAQIPPEFNRTALGCGVVLIWTRDS